MADVVVTGIGMVTPLGDRPEVIVRRIAAGERAFNPPRTFDPAPFACRLAAEVTGLQPEQYVRDIKTVRLMNRDALLAVAAGHLAMEDAGLTAGEVYTPEDIGLFGATGLAGLPLDEVAPLLAHSADAGGAFDVQRFGSEALKRVRPVLTFKILSNMPICFVSIAEQIRGINAVYTPWEGNGAQAIVAGIRAIARGQADCVLVGGCDVKTHELGFISLQQYGVFEGWQRSDHGTVPGEGAAFLVLENAERAGRRGARIRARITGHGLATCPAPRDRAACYGSLMTRVCVGSPEMAVLAADGDPAGTDAECNALAAAGIEPGQSLAPKQHLGNLFAAAAAVQVAIAAHLAGQAGRVLVHCFGHGSQQAAFMLEAA